MRLHFTWVFSCNIHTFEQNNAARPFQQLVIGEFGTVNIKLEVFMDNYLEQNLAMPTLFSLSHKLYKNTLHQVHTTIWIHYQVWNKVSKNGTIECIVLSSTGEFKTATRKMRQTVGWKKVCLLHGGKKFTWAHAKLNSKVSPWLHWLPQKWNLFFALAEL